MARGRSAEQLRRARAEGVKKCKSHCSACGAHFRSDEAFDSHRQFAEGHQNDWDWRICVEPEDETDTKGRSRFKLVTEGGECHMGADWQGNGVVHGVRIWTLDDHA